MIKSVLIFTIALFLISYKASAQQNVNYDDVGVIVNMNDSTSQAIANYFQAKRHIPEVNMIRVHTSSLEEINDSTFKALTAQIQHYLDSANLVSSLNYLVTTKGCPLKVLRAVNDPNGCNSSVESELMLLTPANSSHVGDCIPYSTIGNLNFFQNPYFQHTLFNYNYFHIYLVTRLDAYTRQEVFDLIDHSGPNTYINKDSALFVLDELPTWGSYPYLSEFSEVDSMLTLDGWRVLLNKDTVFVTNQHNVIGYYSWGSNDSYSHYYTQNAIPHNTWAKGSIAETCVSTSGRSFQPGTGYGQSLIADLLDEGATTAKGYVYEPINIAIADPILLFTLYTKLTANGTPLYNMAESYFGASRMIGWMDVVTGDPKTSITTNLSLANGTNEITNSPLQVFPNPASREVFLRAKTSGAGVMEVEVFDILGKAVMKDKFSFNKDVTHTINVEHFPCGIYTVKLQSGNEVFSSKISVVR